MPLVVPGMMGQGGGDDKSNSWMSKLAGKSLGDNHNETVRSDLDASSRRVVVVNDCSDFREEGFAKGAQGDRVWGVR